MAAVSGIINNAAQDVTGQAKNPDPSVLAPNPGAMPSTAVAPTGIIAGAQTPGMTAPPAVTTPPAAPAATPASTTDYTDQIQGAYRKYLGRTGEQSGVDFYNGLLKNGTSMDRINQGFLESDEYKAMHPAARPAEAGPTLLGAPTKWDITPDQTVQGQMKNLIDPNSPYYQQWATAGAQDAAARGFTGNSSIRSTGIMDSVMRGATPIATSDASTYAKAAGYNADMPNQFAIKNQEASNSNSQFNSAQQNDLTKAHLSANTQLATANISADTARFTASLSNQTQKDLVGLNQASTLAVNQARDANAAILASNESAKSAYSSYVAAVAQIDNNNTMQEPAKRAAIITQTQIFNNAIAGLKAANSGTADVSSPLDITQPVTNPAANQVGGVDVSHLLDFGG